jgi:AcrR family transcriptional regulator
MQPGREAVSRRRKGVEQHQGADLAAVAGAMVDDVHEHFLAGHATRGAIGEHEIDPFRQGVLLEPGNILYVLLIGCSDVRSQIVQRRQLTQVGRRIGMSLTLQVRGEDTVDDIAVAQRLDGQSRQGESAQGAKPCQRGQQLVIRPGLVSKQMLQGVVHVVTSREFCASRALRKVLPCISMLGNVRAIIRFSYSHWRRGKMARRPLTKPRKVATQQRSRAMVDALIEATARILVKEGFDKASTNRIAALAGVSVGSLYQYFPSKEALVAAVIERHQQEIMQMVRRELAGVLAEPVDKAVRKLVTVAVKAHRVDPRLHRVLAEQIPRVGELEKLETFNRENFTLFSTYLERHRDELRIDDVGLASYVCVTTIEALTHNAVLHYSAVLTDEMMEALIDEAARLVTGYLKR